MADFFIGPLYVSAGGAPKRVGRFLIPDGLHLWWGDRGVHLYWQHSRYSKRVEFDRLKPVER